MSDSLIAVRASAMRRAAIRTARSFLLFSTVGAALGAQPSVAGPAPVVTVQSGRLAGAIEGASDVYRGVPYAKPPVGELRWRAPEPAQAWSGVRDATAFSAACYQGPPARFGPFTPEFLIKGKVSEDCLYLNVWTPRVRHSRLPVFVWIHGGGFGSGSGDIPIYDGADLAAKGVVVVTINYRLGVFGFLAHPELSAESPDRSSGDYGILDMIEALRWVRRNIAQFGGDPDKVTIGGQSAGAAAVNDLIMAPAAKGLFAHAIAQSGSGMGVGLRPMAEAEALGVELGNKLHATSIAALRAVPADALMSATLVASPGSGARPKAPVISYAPTFDRKILLEDPADASAPIQSNVPLITGFDSDEGFINGDHPYSPQQFEAEVRDRYGDFANRFLALYPHADDAQATRSGKELARDRYMASLIIWAESRTRASGQAVFAYLYDHPYAGGEFARFGAFHTAEVPFVFGALGKGDVKPTSADRSVSKQLQAYWTAFFRADAPEPAGLPQWPRARPSSVKVMGLGDHLGPRPAVSTPARLALFRAYQGAGGRLSLF